MRNSFESPISTDLLLDHASGYDGVLEGLVTTLNEPQFSLGAVLTFRVEDGASGWTRFTVRFERVQQLVISDAWFTGGGFVLYNGGRLLVAGRELVVDLDPGVAWKEEAAVRTDSSFLIVGEGDVERRPVDNPEGRPGRAP